jgi:hypothetical protein
MDEPVDALDDGSEGDMQTDLAPADNPMTARSVTPPPADAPSDPEAISPASAHSADDSGGGHRRILAATGAWTWSRLWAALPFAFRSSRACVSACRKNGAPCIRLSGLGVLTVKAQAWQKS